MCLFHFSTCFEQPSAHHQESQLYQYIIWCISLCVGDCLVCRSDRNLHTRRPPTQSDIYQMMYWYNWFSWWWELGCLKHVEKWNKHIEKKCVKLVINMNCTEMHGQQNIKHISAVVLMALTNMTMDLNRWNSGLRYKIGASKHCFKNFCL